MTATATTEAHAEGAFAELLERHRGIVLNVAATYCRNPADREDLVQEIHLQLWRASPKYDATRLCSTWMYRIVLNVAISFVRDNSLHERPTVALDELHDVEDSGAPPLGDDELARLFEAFVARLDDLNRAMLLLYLGKRSHRAIAAILGITEMNVATKINRLKQCFARELGVVFGIDLTSAASPAWLVANVLVGAAGIAGAFWWYRRLFAEPLDSARRRRAEQAAAGRSLRDAQRFLGELMRFECD